MKIVTSLHILNKKQKYRLQLLSRTGAIFLLLIFLSAPMIEAFHHHHCNPGTELLLKKHTDTGDHQFNTIHAKCKLCDLIKHQSHHFLPTQLPHLVFISPVKKTTASLFRVQAYAGYLLSCTNKGPPAFC
ncbi:hypothetical protein MRBLMN1_002474 [Chitinophaga ginsengisegetis]|uniref:hypothetical protein n=1 Tax=Chitinophaga ginsengisegetis TaxID=393003 RepID=UPI00344A94C9